MSPVLLAAILNFAIEYGLPAALEFVRGINKPGASLDEAIAALDRAQAKSLEEYISEDKAARDQPPSIRPGPATPPVAPV